MSGSSRRGGERVLESRHLIGLFLGVVLLCCVFFTLGYVMGKTQYGNSPVQAASLENPLRPSSGHAAKTSPPQPPASPEWDFYTEKKTTDVPLKAARSGESASSSAVPLPGPASSLESARRAESPSTANSQPAGGGVSAPPPVTHPSYAPPPPRFRAPRMSRNAVVLQVAALRHESDALALADALQQKGFPAFVITPTADNFYRVQVGPFENQTIGDKAKQSLQREGFKAIFRR
ncbi:MAG: SPOR domain-containing protein [Candidatus Acidiferrales bacterium]